MVVSLLLCALQLLVPQDKTVVSDAFSGLGHSFTELSSRAEITRRADCLEIELIGVLKDGQKLKCEGASGNPGRIFYGNTAEVLLQPNKENPSVYYHFASNPTGLLYQARGRDDRWRAAKPVSVTSRLDDSCWKVKFVIPSGALDGAEIASGARWGAEMAILDISWNGLKDWHDFGRYGDLVFTNVASSVRIDSLKKGEDGKIRITYEIDPAQLVGEIGHKGRAIYDYTLDDPRRGCLASFLREECRDALWFTLDRYYYPTQNVKLVYALKNFGEANFSVRRIADGNVVWSKKMAPSGVAELGELEEGDYVFEANDGVKHTAISFKAVNLEQLKDSPREYLIPTSENMVERNKRRLCYEAERYPDYQTFVKRYQQRKAKEPNEKFAIHLGRFENVEIAREYAKACDILEGGIYYCSYAPDLLIAQPEAISLVEAAADGRPFVWWLGAAVPNLGEYRTADELVTAVRYSVLRGAYGNVLHNGHGGVPKHRVRLWDVMMNLETEVSGWYADWKGGKSLTNLVSDVGKTVHIGVRALQSGEFMVIAVNLGRFSESFTLNLPGKEARVITLPGSGSVVMRLH